MRKLMVLAVLMSMIAVAAPKTGQHMPPPPPPPGGPIH